MLIFAFCCKINYMKKVDKLYTIKLFVIGIITLACIYFPYLFNFLAPLMSGLGDFLSLVMCIIYCTFYVLYIIIFNKFLKPKSQFKPFNTKTSIMNLSQLLTVYILTLLAIFLISLSLSFNVNVMYMLGFYTTKSETILFVFEIITFVMKGSLALIAMTYFQEGFEKVFEGRTGFKFPFPYGAFAIFLTYGVAELILGISPVNWILWFCNIIYGLIYLASGKRYSVTLICFILIYLF